jgi:hypothetical protein
MNRLMMLLLLALSTLTTLALADTAPSVVTSPAAKASLIVDHRQYTVQAFRSAESCTVWYYVPPFFENTGEITRLFSRHEALHILSRGAVPRPDDEALTCSSRVYYSNTYSFSFKASPLPEQTLQALRASAAQQMAKAASANLEYWKYCQPGYGARDIELRPIQGRPEFSQNGFLDSAPGGLFTVTTLDTAKSFEASASIDATSPLLEPTLGKAMAKAGAPLEIGALNLHINSADPLVVEVPVLVVRHDAIRELPAKLSTSTPVNAARELDCARRNFLWHAPRTSGKSTGPQFTPIPPHCKVETWGLDLPLCGDTDSAPSESDGIGHGG